MFTGIVETVGEIKKIVRNDSFIKVSILPDLNFDDVKVGDSISVNGACLTVAELNGRILVFDIVRETLKITNLNTLEISKMVNLERAMLLSSRIDGHIVQGHIDGVGEIIDISTDKDNTEIFIRLEEENSKNCIFKGSIAINGISLTIADIKKNIIKIAIIPHTLNNTTLTYVKIGDLVNIETDMLSKYVEKIMSYKNV